MLFVDGFANWNFGGELNDSNFGASTRLGYRWMSRDNDWILGINAGADTTPYEGDYNWQAGVGLEAFNKSIEIRANGYIPLSNSNKEVGRGFSGAYLSNNNLYLSNAYQDWITSYGGLDLEVGTPVASWDNGGLWLYAGYYYLDATVANGPDSSGVSARAEARIADNLAVGATFSYDDIFESKATGYIRYGTQPLKGDAAAEISREQRSSGGEFFSDRPVGFKRLNNPETEDLLYSLCGPRGRGRARPVPASGQPARRPRSRQRRGGPGRGEARAGGSVLAEPLRLPSARLAR